MAYNDIQIEKKFQLSADTVEQVRQRLKTLAEFRKTSIQKDDYFTPAHKDYLDYDYPYEWLRIRDKDDKTILTYQHWHPANTTPFTHCDELETVVECKERIRKIFDAIEMRPLATVEKHREIFMMGDELEIVLDTVKGLGTFMEIETMKDMGSIDAGTRSILEFAEKLGVDPKKTVERGYPYLLLEKKGLLRRS